MMFGNEATSMFPAKRTALIEMVVSKRESVSNLRYSQTQIMAKASLRRPRLSTWKAQFFTQPHDRTLCNSVFLRPRGRSQ